MQAVRTLKGKKLNRLIRIISVATVTLLVALLPYSMLFESKASVCIHYKLFGIQCPFCGMTRAVWYFCRFQFLQAIRMNPIIVALAVLYILDVLAFITSNKKIEGLVKITMILLVIAFVVLYVIRLCA